MSGRYDWLNRETHEAKVDVPRQRKAAHSTHLMYEAHDGYWKCSGCPLRLRQKPRGRGTYEVGGHVALRF
jgi:hypothetical protein